MEASQIDRGQGDTDSGSWDHIAESLSIRRSDFYPVGSLRGKHNYKRFLRIERDGSVRETVHLDVPDVSHREQLICWHYLRHLVHHFLRKDVGVSVVGRDCPWDFKLQLSTGQRFFVEITAIADSAKHFEINKREERFTRWAGENAMPLHELRKLAALFSDENLSRIATEHVQQGRDDSELVANPLKERSQRIFLSNMLEPDESLAQQLRSSIERKSRKAHAGKDATVLLIDNRTSAFDFPDYRSAADELEPMLTNLPFQEVWFYTGYCSDDDGNNAEFSFAPLKVTPSQAEVLRALEVDCKGLHVWPRASNKGSG
jgi:hypothetical protein